MKKTNKLLLTLGTIASASAPLFVAISCGSEISKNQKMSWVDKDKKLYFNFNKELSKDSDKTELAPYLKPIIKPISGKTDMPRLTREDLIHMNTDFQEVTDPRYSNITKLIDGDVVHLEFIGQYQAETQYTLTGDQGFAKRPTIKIDYKMSIDYLYQDHSAITYPIMNSKMGDKRPDSEDLDQRDRERVKVRSNFMDKFVQGMNVYGFINQNLIDSGKSTDNSAVYPAFFPRHGEWNNTANGSEEYANTELKEQDIIALIRKIGGTSINNALNSIPRNYETFISLPKIDLTKALILAPNPGKNVSGEINLSGDLENGIVLNIPHHGRANFYPSKSDVEDYIKNIALANIDNHFYKAAQAQTLTWKTGNEFQDITAVPTSPTSFVAKVNVPGVDQNDNSFDHSFSVTVNVN